MTVSEFMRQRREAPKTIIQGQFSDLLVYGDGLRVSLSYGIVTRLRRK